MQSILKTQKRSVKLVFNGLTRKFVNIFLAAPLPLSQFAKNINILAAPVVSIP
jgi:hypothetical protein